MIDCPASALSSHKGNVEFSQSGEVDLLPGILCPR
jgi:hypothetical protein